MAWLTHSLIFLLVKQFYKHPVQLFKVFADHFIYQNFSLFADFYENFPIHWNVKISFHALSNYPSIFKPFDFLSYSFRNSNMYKPKGKKGEKWQKVTNQQQTDMVNIKSGPPEMYTNWKRWIEAILESVFYDYPSLDSPSFFGKLKICTKSAWNLRNSADVFM